MWLYILMQKATLDLTTHILWVMVLCSKHEYMNHHFKGWSRLCLSFKLLTSFFLWKNCHYLYGNLTIHKILKAFSSVLVFALPEFQEKVVQIFKQIHSEQRSYQKNISENSIPTEQQKTCQGRYPGIPFSCSKERQLGPMPSGVSPTSPTAARGSASASASAGSRSLHARVAELNKKVEEIFKSSKTPKFQEIVFLGGGIFGRDWEAW